MIEYLKNILTSLQSGNLFSESSVSLEDRLYAALNWISLAQKASSGGGISKGYDLLRGRWSPAYPETTGYTIPTLLNAAMILDKPDLITQALSLADYLLECSTPEGGVVHWQDKGKNQPIVFDTGQVIFGWLAAYESSNDERYLLAALNAGKWLVSIQDVSGSWKKNQHLGIEKVIDTRVAWALLRLYYYTNEKILFQAAIKNLDWALTQQNQVGWFSNCSFRMQDDPFTHTLAYTAEGLFECSKLLNNDKYFYSAELLVGNLIKKQRANGSLASTYGAKLEETSSSSCLTGNCQMARLWLQFYIKYKDDRYLEAARRAILFTANTQVLRGDQKFIYGAIAGSSPIYGKYERFKYPNWAVKFFIDALLELNRVVLNNPGLKYQG